jgi:hypothetical protein
MELSSVGTALDLLGKASKALDSVRERAKTSNDAALKKNISKLYDDFLDLKAIILRLTEENAELRRAQVEKPQKPEVRQVGETNYYFVGDQGPYCQPCYDRNNKLVPLSPQKQSASGTSRQCRVCYATFWEEHQRQAPAQRKPYRWQ